MNKKSKGRRKGTVSQKARVGSIPLQPAASRLRRKLLPLSLSLVGLMAYGIGAGTQAMAATVPLASQGPTGGQVVGGAGSITHSGLETVINQQTSKLAINWQTFNVGSNATVLFNQPSSSAIALNRILDQNPSQIFGRVISNGQLFLINTHGFIFGSTAKLNVGSLMASTLDLTPTDFLSSHFNLDAHGQVAGIVNHGLIEAASGGSVSLIGGSVQNDGLIIANYGHINLDGADKAVLDFDGNGLINITITGALAKRLANQEPAVSNSGTLQADSGTVVLQASAAKDLFNNLVNNSGVITASGISTQGGVVRLVGTGGSAVNTGAINVTGKYGGTAQVLSDTQATVTGSINASGTHGGGTIRVGGGLHGGEGLTSSAVTYVGPDATLKANALIDGNGGSVVLWSNTATGFFGAIQARGAGTGSGGNAEVSSHGYLDFNGTADLTAESGLWGTLLLDPGNVTISTLQDSGNSFNTVTGAFNEKTNDTDSNISVATLLGQLGTSDVSITAAGTIDVQNSIDYTGSASRTLTLDAGSTLTFENGVLVSATGSGSLSGKLTGSSVDFLGNSGWTTHNGDLTITANGGATGSANLGNLTLGTGALTASGSSLVVNGALSGGSIDLTGSGSGITLNGNVTSTAGQTYHNAVTLGAGLTLADTNNGNITFNSTIDGAQSLTVNTGGVTTFGGAVGATTPLTSLTTDATGSTVLGGNVTTTGAQTYNDALTLAATATLASTGGSNITLGSTVDGSYALVVNTSGVTSFNGAVGSSSPLTSLTTDAGGATDIGTTIKTSNSQTYNDAVTLTGDSSLTSTGGNVHFVSTVDGTHALTVNASGGAATFDAALGATTALGTLTTNSATLAAGDISADTLSLTTTGGDIALTGKLTVSGTGASSFTTGQYAISLSNASNAFTGAVSLANSGANNVQVVAGSALQLGTVSVGTGTLSLTGVGISQASGTLVQASSAGAVTLDGGTGSVVLGNTGNDFTGAVTVSGAGVTLSDANALDIALLTSTINNDISLTAGSQLTITAPVNIDAGTGNITLNAGTGSLVVGGTLNGAAIDLAGTGGITLNGNVTSTAGQTYRDAVTLGAGLTLADSGGGKIDFISTVDGTQTLAVDTGGITTFGGAVGGTSALASLTTDGAGSTSIGASVTTNGAQTYNDPVTLAGDATLTSNNNGIDLVGALDGAHNLTLSASNGAVTLGGAVGGTTRLLGLTSSSSTLSFGALTVGNLSLTTTGGGISSGSTLDVTGTSAFDAGANAISLTNTSNVFTGALSLSNSGANNVEVDAGSALLLGNVAVGTGTLTLSGASIAQDTGTTLVQAAGAGQVTLTGSTGAVVLGNTGGNDFVGSVSASGTGVTLVDANALTVTSLTDNGNGNIELSAGNALTLPAGPIDAGSGNITLASGTGLTIANTLNGGAIDLTGATGITLGAAVTSSGGQTYNGAVTLTSGLTLADSGGGNIDFTSTLDGGYALTVDTAGQSLFEGVVGGTANLTSLTTDAAGSTLLGGNVTTTGAQTYNDALTLAGNATLLSTGGSNISFGSTVEGAFALAVNTSGTTTFGGAVGGAAGGANALASLTTDGAGSTSIGASVTTSGAQTYNDPVTLTGDATLTSSNNGIDFAGTLDGAHNLTLNASNGAVTLGGTVGGTTPLLSLTSSSKTLVFGLGFGAINVGNLSLTTTGGGISSASLFNVGGTSSFDAGSNAISLTNTSNVFTAALSLGNSGNNNVEVDAATALLLGNVNVGNGTLTLSGLSLAQSSGTTLRQSGSGAVTLTASTGGVDLGNAGNDFVGGVTVNVNTTSAGAGVTLNDANNLTVDALTVGTNGSINLTAGNSLNLPTGSINAGTGNVTLVATTGTLTLPGAIQANNITLTGGTGITVTSNLNAAGNLVMKATNNNKTITQSGGILTVAGTTQITTAGGAITLGSASNDFSGAVSLTGGGAVTIADANGLTLGTLDTGALTVSNSGLLNLGHGKVTGNLVANSNNFAITQSGALIVTGTGTINAGSAAITLTNAGNDFQGALSLTGGTVQVTDTNALTLGTLSTGALTVASTGALNLGQGAVTGLTATSNGGAITQNGALTVTGTGSIDAGGGAITLTNASNDFQSALSLAGGAVQVTDANTLTLGTLATGSLTVNDTGALNLGQGTVTGNLTAASGGGAITQSGALTVTGTGDINAGTAAITLTNAGNDFQGALSLTGGTVQVTDANALTLGTLSTGALTVASTGALNLGQGTVTGNLTAASGGGAITQTGALTVTGTGSIDAGTGAIVLTNAGNDFQGALGLGGAGISVQDANALNVTGLNITGPGDLSLVAGTTLAMPTGNIDVGTGNITLTAGSGSLTQPGTLAGTNIALTSAGALDISQNINASGTLSLQSNGGNITQTAGIVTVVGTSTINAGSGAIDLANTANDFGGAVSASGTGISLADANDLSIASLSDGSNGAVSLVAGGNLNLPASAIDTGTGNLTLVANGGTLASPGALSGANLILTGSNGITLGDNITASGTLALNTANAAINQTAGAIVVNGTTALNAGTGAITLAGTNNDFVGAVSVTGGNTSLTDKNTLTLSGFTTGNLALTSNGTLTFGPGTASGTLTAASNGGLIQQTGAIVVTGDATINAGSGDVTLTNVGNDFQGLVSVTGGIVQLVDMNALSLGTLSTGDLTVNSTGALDLGQGKISGNLVADSHNGAMTQTGALVVTGTSNLNAGTAPLVLTNAGNDFQGTVTASGTGVSLTDANNLDVAGLTIGTNGALSLTSGGSLTMPTGAINTGTGNITIRANGGTLSAPGSLTGATVDLQSKGNLSIGFNVTGTTAVTLVSTQGSISQSGGVITTPTLSGGAAGTVTLNQANLIGSLGAFNASGLVLNNAQALVLSGALNGGTQPVTLTTSSGGLAINNTLTAGALTLNIAGSVTEGSNGSIQATSLTGSATGDLVLSGANLLDNMNSFTAASILVNNNKAMQVGGLISSGGGSGNILLSTTTGGLTVGSDLSGGNVTLTSASNLALTKSVTGTTVSLNAGGNITQTSAGLIAANTLNANASGSLTLDQANAISILGKVTANGLVFNTTKALTVTGPVDGGSSVNLNTSGGDLILNGQVKGTTMSLTASGAITQASSGSLVANVLSGSATGAANLVGSANQIGQLGSFTSAGFSLVDNHALTVTGPINAGPSLSLNATGGNLAINGALNGSNTFLASAGTITEGAGGSITATTLSGQAQGVTQLGTQASPIANYVGTLGGFSSPAGFSFTNAQTLTLAAVGGSSYTVDGGTGNVFIGVTNGDLMQADKTPLYDGAGTFSASGAMGTQAFPIYVVGNNTQLIAQLGIAPAYFYAIDRNGNILALAGELSVNVPTSLLSSRAQNANRAKDTYIDPSVITANYRSFGVVPSGILLPSDQQNCNDNDSDSGDCPND